MICGIPTTTSLAMCQRRSSNYMLAEMPSLMSKLRMDNTSIVFQRLANALAVLDSTATAGCYPAQKSPIGFRQAGFTYIGGFSIRFAADTVKDASDVNTSLSTNSVSTLSESPVP